MDGKFVDWRPLETRVRDLSCMELSRVLHTSDLVDVVSDELWVVELHVSVHCPLAEKLVVVVVFVIASLNHGQVLPSLVFHLGDVGLLDVKLGEIVVDGVGARRGALQQSSGVQGSIHVVEWGVGLAALVDD